jgi:hypothetical protein
VVYKERRGKKFMLFPGVEFQSFYEFITDKSYGTTLTKELPVEQIQARSTFLDDMAAHGYVRIEADNPLPKAAYMIAIDKFKAGDYDMVFIQRRLTFDLM